MTLLQLDAEALYAELRQGVRTLLWSDQRLVSDGGDVLDIVGSASVAHWSRGHRLIAR
jgi:hypothetical protein